MIFKNFFKKLLAIINWIFFDSTVPRKLTGILNTVVVCLCIGIVGYHLYIFTLGSHEPYLHRVIHVCTILVVCFLTFSHTKKNTKVPVIDLIFSLLTIGIMVYLLVNGQRLLYERVPIGDNLTPLEVGIGVTLLILIAEASRRVMGSVLTVLALLCMLYAFVAPLLSGMWSFSGMSFNQIIDFTFFGDRSLFGDTVGISATYIFLFLIFASLLTNSGATEFFNDLAIALAGRSRGGPAKVSVIGSGLIGSISGSAAANVAVTGSVTIPLMLRIGIKPNFAAGVESAAATGGHIMPPIMSGITFVMADILGVQYWTIVAIAFIPAILYFLGIFVQVHAYAVGKDIKSIDEKDYVLPTVSQTFKKGWQHIIPLATIITLLVIGFSPIRAALYSIPVVILVSWFRPETRMGFKKLIKACLETVKMIRIVMLACALAGILMGFLFITGAGGNLIAIIQSFAGGNLFISLCMAAVFCLFLGLSLSGLASYLLTAILIAPVAISLGVPAISIHFFAFYYASLAQISPPVGPVAFQAATMAGANPYATGFIAMRLAMAAMIVPFIWVYWPGLLLMGGPLEIAAGIAVGTGSVIVLGFALEGCFIKKLGWIERLLLVAGVCSVDFGNGLFIALGLVVVVAVMALHWIRSRRSPVAAAT